MQPKTLQVLPNPWMHIHIYSDGVPRPVCAVNVDMAEHIPSPNRYVGARIERAEITQKRKVMRVGTKTVQRQPERSEIFWDFATKPETIPNTGYYRDHIRAGALIAADEETARLAGIPFEKPELALEHAKAKAIAAFDAAYGEGAFESAQPPPEGAAPAAAETPAPTTAPEDSTTPARKRSKD